MSSFDAIPKGSTVFVTGGTGYIGAHTIDQFLQAPLDLKVRAAARSQDKADALSSYFSKKYSADRIETIIIPDLTPPNAYDEAVKGVSAIAHLAAPVSFEKDWDEMVPPTIASVKNILGAAKKEPSVKRFVFCSSSGACGVPKPVPRAGYKKGADDQHFDDKTWNEGSVKKAKALTEKGGGKKDGASMYYAMKTLSEEALWDWVKTEKPSFTTVSILPNANFGPVLPFSSASTGGWLTGITKGNTFAFQAGPQWFVDVRDTALLHVLAATSSSIKEGERIWAVTAPFSWAEILDELKTIQPQSDLPKLSAEQDTVDATDIVHDRFLEILEPHGRPYQLKQTIADTFNQNL